jgi:RNA polymerase sigma-70 factor (ECF subfamily)
MSSTDRQDRSAGDSSRRKKERFMALFRPLHGRLSRFAQGMTGDREEARDLVHDTVLVAFEGFERVKDEKAFLCYLFTIASRIHRRKQRRGRWFGSYDEEQAGRLHDNGTAPDTSAEVALLHDALKRLPGEQREAVVLFEISDLSLEEIRKIQGGTLSGVKSRVTRGRRRLAGMLGADRERAPEDASDTATRNGRSTGGTDHIIFSSAQINEQVR